jgi:hypothetical protein
MRADEASGHNDVHGDGVWKMVSLNVQFGGVFNMLAIGKIRAKIIVPGVSYIGDMTPGAAVCGRLHRFPSPSPCSMTIIHGIVGGKTVDRVGKRRDTVGNRFGLFVGLEQ